jgi:hypothetical protein
MGIATEPRLWGIAQHVWMPGVDVARAGSIGVVILSAYTARTSLVTRSQLG